jgi:hypothetical protein
MTTTAVTESAFPQFAETPYPRPAYAWYVVFVLTFAYIFSFMDRQILNLMVGPIRRDLQISDTEISLPHRIRVRAVLHVFRASAWAHHRFGQPARPHRSGHCHVEPVYRRQRAWKRVRRC